MYLLNSSFVFLKNLGEKTNDKIDRIKKKLYYFPEFINEVEPVVILKSANQGIEVNFADNVIVYFYTGDSNDLDFEKLKETFEVLFDSLEISNQGKFQMVLDGLINSEIDTMEKSRSNFKNYLEIDETLYGAGLRLLRDSEKFTGEIKVEPYVKDNSKIYGFSGMESKEEIKLEEINFQTEFKQAINIIEKINELYVE